MKKYISFFSIIITAPLFGLSSRILLPNAFNLAQFTKNVSPKNTEFAFDIHGVLLCRSKKEIGQACWKHKRRLFTDGPRLLGQKIYYWVTGKKQGLYSQINQMMEECRGNSGESYMLYLKDKDPELARLIAEICNSYVPMPGIQQLLYELTRYNKKLASDIGPTFFENLYSKAQCRPIFNHFSGGQVVSYNKQLVQTIGTDLHLTICSQRKPSGTFFSTWRKNHQEKTYLIFIDDKMKNVRGARNAGFIAIHFKDAQKLRLDLRELGIF